MSQSFFGGGGRFAFGNPLRLPNQSLGGLAVKIPPTCFLTSSTTISVPTGIGSFTLMTWDTITFQNDQTMHSTTVNPSRITIPITGKYLVETRISWAYDVSGTTRRFRVLANGTPKEAEGNQWPSGTVPKITPELVGWFALNRGDYVEVDADHDATGSVLYQLLSFGVTWLTP